MKTSTKLGIASLLLTIGFIVLPFQAGDSPFGVVFGVLAFVVGILAARRGSKWWLLVPGAISVLVVFILLMTFHAE
jgi:hypothetical protein